MKKIVVIGLLTLLNITASAETMVFLVEDDKDKHVGLSTDMQTYSTYTRGRKWHLYPTISADGKVLAYSEGTGQDDLTLMVEMRDQGLKMALTHPGFVLQPRFANYSRIFFSHLKNGKNQIAYTDLNDGEARPIHYIEDESPSFFPAPFKSGTRVVYQRNAEKKEIVIFDILENKREVIGYGMSPSLSKDERYIAYTNKVDGNWDIYIYDRIKKNTIRATNHPGRDFSPAFRANGDLVYTSDRKEEGVFSIFSQVPASWTQKSETEEKILISEKGVSFYAPRFTGREDIETNKLKPLTGEARSSFGSLTLGDITYVVGGHQGKEHTYPPESFTARVSAYDKKTRRWKELAPRLHKAHGFSLAGNEKYLYAFGGFAYEEKNYPKWKSLSVIERYDIEKNKWEVVGQMPRKRSSNVVAQVGHLVYLIGGWDSTPKSHRDLEGTWHSEIDVFDLETEKVSTLPTKLPLKRRAFTGFVREGKIYLLGGIGEGSSHFELVDLFTEFDPTTESFKELPRLPFATFAPAAGSLGEHAYLFGGMFKLGERNYEYVPHIYSFNWEKNRWQHTGRYLRESKGFSQVVTLDKCLGILGGHSYKNNTDAPVKTFEKLCLSK